ncbi:MAG TPA: hypothetical protein VLG38_04170, partial [Gammaproteobacteria bacterium]|nr:hypothetical protein [Gammaproteobacteria bacterium]
MKTRNFICSSLASKVDPGNILRFSNFLASNPNIDLVNLDFRNYHTIDELYIGVAEDNSTGPILFHFLYDPATHIANNAFTTETIRSISDLIKSRNADSKFNIYVTSTNWFLALSSAAIDNTLALIKGSDVALFTDEIMQKSFMQVADTSLIEASLANRIKNSIIVNLESSQPEREITINPHFMYEEREILTAAHGLIKKHGLKFSGRDGSGVVLDAQDNIQVSHGRVNTVAHTLVIGMSESADASNSNLIIDALSRAVDLDVPTNKHRILFPVHIFNQRHFCLAALYLNVDRSRPGEIEPEVELHIIESISGPSCEQSVGSMLHAVFKEHIKFPIKLKTCTFTARLQPDGVSCGVIVAHRIETLVLSNSFDEGGTYTADNILVMRARQIDAVNDEAFTQRQFQIIPDAKLSEPTHIHDYHAFSTKLENYLQTVESDERERFYDIALIFVICELNMLRLSFSESSQNVEKITLVRDKLSRAQQLLRNRSDPELKFALTTLSAGIAAEKSKQYLAEIREWFDYHEEPLCGVAYDRLLDCFFETHRGSDDALIWTDNGVHALYNVLEIKFDLHLIEAKPPSLHASMSLNSAGLSYDEIIDDTKTYLYRGTTDINCRATGIGFESTEHAKYVGFFDQNKKTMKGVDENFVSDINTKLYLYGARDLKG